ncbi:MAG: two pore domain potassium channel family protein [Chloroflexi bacterium]|nr:two pore domain potassium channel family protein [Chloroflexota bacterium]MBP7041197.1 two pore domain potassium channel family protein [Chloroflexota bacterium]
MFTLYLFISTLARRIKIGFKDPEFRGLFYTTLIIIGIGGLFYHSVEGWSWLDSFYFTIITLTTVGYGDFSPKTDLGKLFTMVYVVLGLGIISSFILMLARQSSKDQPFLLQRFRSHTDKHPEDTNAPNSSTKDTQP